MTIAFATTKVTTIRWTSYFHVPNIIQSEHMLFSESQISNSDDIIIFNEVHVIIMIRVNYDLVKLFILH